MYIKFVEIANFRKLLSIRVDFSTTTTLFVGANNSGKTSAMLAMRKFLSPRGRSFETHDITLCHWPEINKIGQGWLEARSSESPDNLDLQIWADLLPSLDLWLHVENDEFHHVRDLIPTLDWEGGLLGVRLRLEPKNLEVFRQDFLNATADAEALQAAGKSDPQFNLTVWPSNLIDFLDRRLSQHFTVCAYPLDPTKVAIPATLPVKPQALSPEVLKIEGNPLNGLIRVNDISAQRGLGDTQPADAEDMSHSRSGSHRLSDQLRDYYKKHLDPTDCPDPNDIEALQAIEAAQTAFDARLSDSFKLAFSEVEDMGYPGVTDPRPHVSTRLNAIDSLNHSAAVSFELDVIKKDGEATPLLRIPEDNNGLGYQNLISMIFRLLSFRDAWMRVGKAAKNLGAAHIEPLHLVLIEEPEAHLHAQVQQVFINKAYKVLRKHKDLGENKKLQTQLVVSTHSSHVAHEIPFSCLRYFRRLPAGMVAKIPVSGVINMSEVFGTETETERFVTRYLRSQHADLFFADAAILVEGPAERMLLPNFIRVHHSYLNQCYITMLEIGGSHAHRLRPLIEHLGLLTLIVTDLDTKESTDGKSVQPQPGANQVTNNETLKSWVPKESDVDKLFVADGAKKIAAKMDTRDQLFDVRVAYQIPLKVKRPDATEEETAYPYTFEDALVFENLAFFSTFSGYGLVRKLSEAITSEPNVTAIGQKFFEALRNGKKAEFALDIIAAKEFETLTIPRYIREGLDWLEAQLRKKKVEILPTTEEVAK